MPRHNYRQADLLPLTGSIRAIRYLNIKNHVESIGEALTLLASAEDVPPPLCRYYAKVGKGLTEKITRLNRYLCSVEREGENLSRRINSALGRLNFTEEDMNRLRHVNSRLLELEKSLKQMIDGMRKRLDGLDPLGVKWDEWDMVEIILWLRVGTDPERPSYDPDNKWAEGGLMEPLDIRVELNECWNLDNAEGEEPWGLDDGQNHNDLGGAMRDFHQCYLFHEIYDHADVGFWGMLHLRSLWIEIIPHRSGDFYI